ncbi:hypothetical protein BGZ73_001208 [Actinomortierella ambigua]|nr:hypothetical protein BGZ73_001208 [Actinomortierella ambigua]
MDPCNKVSSEKGKTTGFLETGVGCLFNVIDGEFTLNPFCVKIPSSGTLDDLKELIKTKKTTEFDNISADRLCLWRATHPVIVANKRWIN